MKHNNLINWLIESILAVMIGLMFSIGFATPAAPATSSYKLQLIHPNDHIKILYKLTTKNLKHPQAGHVRVSVALDLTATKTLTLTQRNNPKLVRSLFFYSMIFPGGNSVLYGYDIEVNCVKNLISTNNKFKVMWHNQFSHYHLVWVFKNTHSTARAPRGYFLLDAYNYLCTSWAPNHR